MGETIRRAVLELARKPAMTKLMSHLLPGLDKLARTLTGGRVTSVAQWLLPTLVLRSIGRKSGQEREHTLVHVPDHDGRPLLVGTNFGGDNHPAWTYNLLATPDATIELDGRTEAVTAVAIPPDEQTDRWPAFDAVYAGFVSYRERIGDSREIRMFRLEPRHDRTVPPATGAS